MLTFPRQDIPEGLKNTDWCKQHLDFARALLQEKDNTFSGKIKRLYDRYNGILNEPMVQYLNVVGGKKTKTKFINYRISKTKIDMLVGEWLGRPLNSYVYTTNQSAKAEKLDKYTFMLGAYHARKELNTLKEVAGVDVMEGMEIPEEEEKFWEMVNVKTRNEGVLQTILNDTIRTNNIKMKLMSNWQDDVITGYTAGKIEIRKNGTTDWRAIDPRDFIAVDVAKDPMYKQSPLLGERRIMTINEVLGNFELTQHERNILEKFRNNPSDFTDRDFGGNNPFKQINNQLMVEVISIEWKSVRPHLTKVIPQKNNENPLYRNIAPEYYDKHKESILNDITKNKYEVVTSWYVDIWEAHRIANIIDVQCRRRPFIPRKNDDIANVHGLMYKGLKANEVNGTSVSIGEMCENLDHLYDTVMWQIHKEIGKAKGTIYYYDRAGLPKKKTQKEVLYEMVNDGFVDIDSSAAGNMANKNLNPSEIFGKYDLGVSSTFPYLLELKRDIVNTLERLTGISDERQGIIAASSTATNAQSSIQSSRAMTEHYFYMFNKFCEDVFEDMCEISKLTWPTIDPERAKIVLGDKMYEFLKVGPEIMNDDYSVYITDGGKENQIRQRLFQLAEASLNNKQIRLVDIADMEDSDTIAEVKAILRRGWDTVEKAENERAKMAQEAAAQNVDKQLQTNIQLAREDREDKQNHDVTMEFIKQGLSIQDANAQANKQMMIDNNKAQQAPM